MEALRNLGRKVILWFIGKDINELLKDSKKYCEAAQEAKAKMDKLEDSLSKTYFMYKAQDAFITEAGFKKGFHKWLKQKRLKEKTDGAIHS